MFRSRKEKEAKKKESKKDTKKEKPAKKEASTDKKATMETKTTKAVKEKKPATTKTKEKTPKKEEKKPAAKVKTPKVTKEKKPAAKVKTPKVTKEKKPIEKKKAPTAIKETKTPTKELAKTPAKEKPKTSEKVPEKVEKEEPLPSYEGIELFNKWSYNDLVVVDPGLKAYISLRPVITPHTGGRYEHQRFKKAEMPIVERLVNKLMRTKKGTGKKERMIKSVKVTFEIINLQTGKNPIQVLIDAIQNTAPREEVTRITYGGMAQLQSVDVAPMRRVDIALTNIVEGVYKKSFNNILTAEEILARELMDAADNKPSSNAISKMQEIERIALSAR